jgi:mRNA interferase RelE/StbE
VPEDRGSYALFTTPAADRQLAKLPIEVQDRLDPAIDALAEESKPPGSAKLQGYTDTWRVRVGDYRIIYEVDEAAGEITVIRLAHRREAYR